MRVCVILFAMRVAISNLKEVKVRVSTKALYSFYQNNFNTLFIIRA